jgi:hypothetical protein
MYAGALNIHGQLPDQDYPVSEHLIHGGRIKFDLKELSEDEQQQFFEYVTNNVAVPRAYATHRFGDTLDPEGSPKEIKSSVGGALSDFLRSPMEPVHFGINLAIGGRSTPCCEGSEASLGKMPKEDGQWGHLYIHRDVKLKSMLIGIEGGGPHQENLRTNQAHSLIGAKGELSAFNEPKGSSKQLHEEQSHQGKTPINISEDVNWATVKITKGSLNLLLAGNIKPLDIVRSPHPLSEHAKPDRLQAMQDWSKQSAPIRDSLTSLQNKLKDTFDAKRIFFSDKDKYNLPLANLNKELYQYHLQAKRLASEVLQQKYDAVMSAIEMFKDKSVTVDPKKLSVVDEFKEHFEKFHSLECRHLKESQLPDLLQAQGYRSFKGPIP